MRLQAKDIPTQPILNFLASGQMRVPNLGASLNEIRDIPEVAAVVTHLSDAQSYRLVLAKMRGLIKRKVVDGCGCGCRGDFNLTPSETP